VVSLPRSPLTGDLSETCGNIADDDTIREDERLGGQGPKLS